MKITERIRAALFSTGRIRSLKTSETDCQRAIVEVLGQEAHSMSEQDIVWGILHSASQPASAGVRASTPDSVLGISGGYDSGPRVTGVGRQRFAADALAGLSMSLGLPVEDATADAQRLSSAPLSAIAQQCLDLAGVRYDPYNRENLALQALQMVGTEVRIHSSTSVGVPYLSGDFPNLMSALAGKILDQAILAAPPTYPVWTGRIPDVADFKPYNILGISPIDELDAINEDRVPESLAFSEELSGYIQVGRYGNRVGLTPVMVANDDLDAFTQGLTSLAMAHEHTLNRLCLALIGSNTTLLDGYSLFDDTNHGNDVEAGSGGPPSTTQAATMKSKHRTQTGVGGVGKVRTGPRIALVPTALEEAAMQTFLEFARLAESKVAVTDATINVYRGTIEPVVEPDLDDYSSAVWYTFADPRVRRCICHTFQRGYGRGGRRSSYFEPATKVLYFDIEGRFAACAAGHRGAVRNMGA